jgi:hypothetical protein
MMRRYLLDARPLYLVRQEFLIYVNKRRPEVEVELDPYVKKYPGKVSSGGGHKALDGDLVSCVVW